jgi:predicted Rossmann fold flavoprotein
MTASRSSALVETVDVVVIGAGAAGLMAAAIAAQRGRRVLVLEHTTTIGAKILISGGGRCNFTNIDVRPERFLSSNAHFARSALARYTQQDFIALVRRHGIAFYEKTLGQLFCEGAGQAKAIVAMLMAEATGAGAQVRTGVTVQQIFRADDCFTLATSASAFRADSVIVATGGLSIPKIGATDFAYRLAQQFGLPVVPVRPGLVPLTFGADDLALMAPLSGVSLDAVASAGEGRGKGAFREALLFTHRGLSGPSILQISSYWREGEAIALDLFPGRDAAAHLLARKRDRPRAELRSVLAEDLPQRLADRLCETRLVNGRMADLRDKTLEQAAASLQPWTLTPTGTEGYAKAEVTLGGIDTAALSQKTMETKAVPGLFFVGEAVDVTGWLGGYNFQWAWSSGWCAGQAA